MQFVIIDMDKHRSGEQQRLVKKYYKGYIPHVVILDAEGNVVYNRSGEIGEAQISPILDGLLNGPPK